MSRKTVLTILLAIAVLALAGCAQLGPEATPAPPTKTPKPTFTHTPDWTPTQEVFPTFTPPPTATPELSEPAEPEEGEDTPSEDVVNEEPTAAPEAARLTANQTANIRSGPGTNYAAIGRLSAGDSYPILGKNAAGDWYQFEIEGREGWVTASLVSIAGDAGTIQVAQNIPPPPTPRPQPTAAPRPVNPPAPPPTAAPQPTAPPARRYEFNIAAVQACNRQPAGNWFDGTVYKGGQPFNGALVVFSYAPDGPWATPPQISGPHEGYTNWNAGYYSHIIKASDPQAGEWFVWIVDAGGARISEIAHWTSTGPGDGCNAAVIDFDSR